MKRPAKQILLIEKLSEGLVNCMGKLDRLLVPPFEEVSSHEFEKFVAAIHSETQAEAVSIFLVAEDDTNALTFRAGTGYKQEYCDSLYFRNGATLTSTVFRTK